MVKKTLEETRLEEAARIKAHEKMLVESVFNAIKNPEIPQEIKDIDAIVKGQITELTIHGKKYNVVTDSFVQDINRKIEILVEKSKKDNILIESRVKNLEKFITGSAMITERLEKTNSALLLQNRQLERNVQKLLREVAQIRLSDD